MNISTGMKWFTGIVEACLAIPLIGGMIVLGSSYSVLSTMFVLHAITLILSIRDRQGKGASILGLVTSVVSVIPIVGWFMHVITAIALFISAIASKHKTV